MFLFLAASSDPAAMNAVERLKEGFGILPGRETEIGGRRILLQVLERIESVEPPLEVEEILVTSRHVSKTARPCFTVHVPGELQKGRLAVASPLTVKKALEALHYLAGEFGPGYEVSLEATHHGPVHLDVPMTFVEIGGSEEQWRERRAGEVLARAMVEAVAGTGGRLAVGVGGPHYAPRHTQVALRTDAAVGHILPDYVNLTPELVELAVRRTRGRVELLAADWKGLNSAQRAAVREASRRLGIELVREDRRLRVLYNGRVDL
jgi:D-aminoacyl-tRNA deacylase